MRRARGPPPPRRRARRRATRRGPGGRSNGATRSSGTRIGSSSSARSISTSCAATLGGRVDRRGLDLPQRPLRERREGADLLDLVAEQLDPERLAAGRRDRRRRARRAPRTGRGPRRARPVRSRRPRAARPADRCRARRPAAIRSGAGRSATGGIPSASAVAETQTRPPRASTSRARARSPIRCGGGSRPGLPANAARREERHRLVAEEPRGRLGDVARVGVLGQRDDEPSAELVVERRDDERQDGLGHAGTRRQRLSEFLEALLSANALDEAVENGTVHDYGPNEAFGRVVMVRLRQRLLMVRCAASRPSASRRSTASAAAATSASGSSCGSKSASR